MAVKLPIGIKRELFDIAVEGTVAIALAGGTAVIAMNNEWTAAAIAGAFTAGCALDPLQRARRVMRYFKGNAPQAT